METSIFVTDLVPDMVSGLSPTCPTWCRSLYLALSRCSKAVVSLGVMRFLVSRGGLGFGTTALKRNFFDNSCVDSVLPYN